MKLPPKKRETIYFERKKTSFHLGFHDFSVDELLENTTSYEGAEAGCQKDVRLEGEN